jgi:hypothetical protein
VPDLESLERRLELKPRLESLKGIANKNAVNGTELIMID